MAKALFHLVNVPTTAYMSIYLTGNRRLLYRHPIWVCSISIWVTLVVVMRMMPLSGQGFRCLLMSRAFAEERRQTMAIRMVASFEGT